jgi:peroxiredoxin
MKNIVSPALILFIINFFGLKSQTLHPEPETLKIGSEAPDFKLPGIDGNSYTLNSFEKADVLVIIFSCNHCPTAQAYEDRIISLARDYKPKGVEIVVISPNSTKALNLSELGYTDLGDSFEEMKQRAKDKGFNFPYLYDGDDQKTALLYGPVATPHCFVFDRKRQLKYVGRIDGNEKPGTGHGEDIRNAIDAVLEGSTVRNPVTKVFGCSIKWSWKDEYTRKLYEQWSELPVTLEDIDSEGIRQLLDNQSEKLRLVNIWATWCGPCTIEFPDLVTIDRMYRGRQFEFITISADKQARKADALRFLKIQEASNKNYIFDKDNVYELMDAVDPAWQGAIPYSLLIEPGGHIIFKNQGMIDPGKLKKLIVENRFIGRYY